MPPFMRSSSKATSVGISTPVNSRGMAGLLSSGARWSREQPYANAIREEKKGLFGGGLFDEVFRDREDSGDDHVHSFAVGMEPVRLVERRVGSDAVEEEGIEEDAVLLREAGEDGIECRAIVLTQVARCQHAGEEDRKLAFMEFGQDAVEGDLRLCRIDPTQGIVGAKFDDDPIDIRHQRPIEPFRCGGAGVARHPGIGDHDIVTARLQSRFEPGRKGVGRIKAKACRQAVAERQDMEGLCRKRQRCEEDGQEDEETESHILQVGTPCDNSKSPADMDNSTGLSHLEPMPAPIISLENVHLTLSSRAGPVDILRGIDLTVQSGEALGIVGPSGSGKTTLLMVIAGLERGSSGAVHVNGTTLAGKNEDA